MARDDRLARQRSLMRVGLRRTIGSPRREPWPHWSKGAEYRDQYYREIRLLAFHFHPMMQRK
jgi:hypothetical protein